MDPLINSEPFAQQALDALHIHRICLYILPHLALGALALLALQVTAALLAPAQLSFTGDFEPFCCCLVCFCLWHGEVLSSRQSRQQAQEGLPLPLLVFGIFTDHVYSTLALDDLALRATTFDRWCYFHVYHLPVTNARPTSQARIARLGASARDYSCLSPSGMIAYLSDLA